MRWVEVHRADCGPGPACDAAWPVGRETQLAARRSALRLLATGGLLWLLGRGVRAQSATAVVLTEADGVSLDEARTLHDSGKAVLIDVREPDETAAGVARGARLLPMSQIKARLAEIPTDPAKPVLLICRTQNRSSATLKALRQLPGYAHVRYVRGGMSEWARRDWPMVKP